jgi:hypothetical protein
MMNWKGFGRKLQWPKFKIIFLHSPVGTEENHDLSQDSRSPGRDLKPGPLENEAGVLTLDHDVRCQSAYFLGLGVYSL